MQYMLRLQTIGLAIVAAFALSVVAASSAMAAHEWLINKGPIAAPVKIHALSLVLFTDSKATGGEVKIHCRRYRTEKVGPGGTGLVEKITAELLGTNNRIHCTFDKAGACKSNSLLLYLAINLPWLTLLSLLGTEVRYFMEKDGSGGPPGWKVVCTNILGGETVDECTVELASTALANVAAGVDAFFDASTQQAKCSIGGAGAGIVSGFVLLESPSATEKLTFD